MVVHAIPSSKALPFSTAVRCRESRRVSFAKGLTAVGSIKIQWIPSIPSHTDDRKLMHFTKREKRILLSKKPRKFLISSVENRSNTSPERMSNKCLEINAAQPSQSDDLDFNLLWLLALKRCCPSEYLARNKCAGSAIKSMNDIDPTLDLLQSWWMGTEDLRGLEVRRVPSLSYRLRKFRRQATESVLEKYTTVMANQGYLPHSIHDMIATKYHEDSEPASKLALLIGRLDAIVASDVFSSAVECHEAKVYRR